MRRPKWLVPGTLVISVTIAGCAPQSEPRPVASTPAAAAPSPTLEPSPTALSSTTPTPFYAQLRTVDGFTVKASAKVIPAALDVAARQFAFLTAGDPAIVARLRAVPLEVAVIARSETVTDLPEYRHLRGHGTLDGRAYDGPEIRGLGPNPCVAAEENLLGLAGDVFQGENILIHECAHGLFRLGLDSEQQARWAAIFGDAMAAGRWRDTYAAVDLEEFFAELTQSYFAVNPESQPGIHNDINTPAELASYEPRAYEFLRAVFGPPRAFG